MEIVSKYLYLQEIFSRALLGSLFITLFSFVWIPYLPIAFTLQTFALFLLALLQTPSITWASAVFYLIEATLGLPVLCGHSNSLWILGPSGGYLIAFPFAGYVISQCAQGKNAFHQMIAIFYGQVLIYLVGWIWLTAFIGRWEAFKWGVLFFIPSALLKNGFSIFVSRYLKHIGVRL